MLKEAAADFRHLLGRGYPRQRSLDLVGDRHALTAAQRELLRRGVFAPAEAERRRRKLLPLTAVAGQALAVDGHNQLITLETALSGGALVWADDGAVRDTAGRGRGYEPGPLSQKAAELLLAALAGAARVDIYLDAPLSKSGRQAARLRQMLINAGLTGDAQAVPVPERQLLAHAGLVASGDSAVIDQAPLPIDLAGLIIQDLLPAGSLVRL